MWAGESISKKDRPNNEEIPLDYTDQLQQERHSFSFGNQNQVQIKCKYLPFNMEPWLLGYVTHYIILQLLGVEAVWGLEFSSYVCGAVMILKPYSLGLDPNLNPHFLAV